MIIELRPRLPRTVWNRVSSQPCGVVSRSTTHRLAKAPAPIAGTTNEATKNNTIAFMPAEIGWER